MGTPTGAFFSVVAAQFMVKLHADYYRRIVLTVLIRTTTTTTTTTSVHKRKRGYFSPLPPKDKLLHCKVVARLCQ